MTTWCRQRRTRRIRKIAIIVAVTLVVVWRLLASDWFTVRVTSDQARLARIAMEDEDEWCRLFAAEKLVDESLLAKIAVEDSHRDVRAAAVKKLKDQGLMARIAVEDEDRFVREAAVEKLHPPYDHVDDVMMNTENYQMRLERRKEAIALVEQIVESRERYILRVAVEKLIKMRTQAQPKERESP